MSLQLELIRSKKDLWLFLLTFFFLFTCKLLYLYIQYDSFHTQKKIITKGRVLKQYTKTKKNKTYQVLKIKTNDNLTLYTTASKKLQNIQNKYIKLKIYPKKISFLEYLKGFYTPSYILHVNNSSSLKTALQKLIQNQHTNQKIQQLYLSIFLAYPLEFELYKYFSALGVSHLFAISGFHLSILVGIIFFVFSFFYTPFHKRYFPYRHKRKDLFILSAIVLFFYLQMLEYPPSLLRAYGMFLIGFFLYDRGYKIISLQTLFITTLLLLSLDPRLLFSYGFWLSILGVFYILLFLHYFAHLSFLKQLFLIPLWVYLMMLPTSLYLFHTFSLYHPFSVFLSILFTLFYPLSLFLHFIGFGDLLDPIIEHLINLDIKTVFIDIQTPIEVTFLTFSFFALFKKTFLYIVGIYAIFIFFYALWVYHYTLL